MELLYSLSSVNYVLPVHTRLARGKGAGPSVRRQALAALGAALLLTLMAHGAGAQDAAHARRARQALITVKGVANPFSSFGIVKRLRQVPGVRDVSFDLYSGQALVTLDPAVDVTEAQLREAVRNASYTAGKIQWRELPLEPPAATDR
jgi:copper chaperone CopZ